MLFSRLTETRIKTLVALPMVALVTVVGLPSLGNTAASPLVTNPAFGTPTFREIPQYGTEEVGLPTCQDPLDRDCLAAVTVISDRTRIKPELLSESPDGTVLWRYTRDDNLVVTFRTFARMTPLGVIQSWGGQIPGVRVFVDREPTPAFPRLEAYEVDCGTGVQADCVAFGPAFPEADAIEIDLRLSWLRPLNIAMSGREIFFRKKSITNGNLYTLRAKEALVAVVTNSQELDVDLWTTSYWQPDLIFVLDHAGNSSSDSAYDPRCAPKGAPVTASNSASAGQPYWDNSSKSLNFGVLHAHYAPDGSVNRGRFEAKFPIQWLRCQSGKRNLKISGFIVQVLNEDGVEQAATTSLSQRRGLVTVRALDFHYSSPTIRLVKRPNSRQNSMRPALGLEARSRNEGQTANSAT